MRVPPDSGIKSLIMVRDLDRVLYHAHPSGFSTMASGILGDQVGVTDKISSLALRCSNAFGDLRRALSDSTYRGLGDVTQDEFGRFQVWDANVGSFGPPRSSAASFPAVANLLLLHTSTEYILERLEDVLQRGESVAGRDAQKCYSNLIKSHFHCVWA